MSQNLNKICDDCGNNIEFYYDNCVYNKNYTKCPNCDKEYFIVFNYLNDFAYFEPLFSPKLALREVAFSPK